MVAAYFENLTTNKNALCKIWTVSLSQEREVSSNHDALGFLYINN
jgi:hypothetical protein